MKISVITWDADFRENTHTIDCFCQQDFPEGDFEFIWVDFFDSNNLVREKIGRYPHATLLPLKNLQDTPWHIGKCINTGVMSSSGKVLVICDGDIMVGRDFLSYVWQSHQNYEDLVVYFRRYDELEEDRVNQGSPTISYLKKKTQLMNPTNYGGCMTLKRKNFEIIRGYETHSAFSGPGCQSLETYTRLLNAGMAIQWARGKKIYHPWHANSGLPGHADGKALKFAQLDYPWIIPYAGIEQSWIVHCRKLSEDFIANTVACEKHLKEMPLIDLNYYSKFCSIAKPGRLNLLTGSVIKLFKRVK
jgi:hypothetical protein